MILVFWYGFLASISGMCVMGIMSLQEMGAIFPSSIMLLMNEYCYKRHNKVRNTDEQTVPHQSEVIIFAVVNVWTSVETVSWCAVSGDELASRSGISVPAVFCGAWRQHWSTGDTSTSGKLLFCRWCQHVCLYFTVAFLNSCSEIKKHTDFLSGCKGLSRSVDRTRWQLPGGGNWVKIVKEIHPQIQIVSLAACLQRWNQGVTASM